MRLVVALPHRIEIDTEVDKVGAEGLHGTFTMLPRHLDHVVLLSPGILTYVPSGAPDERYVAVKGGVLTKVGPDVRVATVAAVQGERLEDLERTVVRSFRRLDERERDARAAMIRIESHVLQEMFQFEEEA